MLPVKKGGTTIYPLAIKDSAGTEITEVKVGSTTVYTKFVDDKEITEGDAYNMPVYPYIAFSSSVSSTASRVLASGYSYMFVNPIPNSGFTKGMASANTIYYYNASTTTMLTTSSANCGVAWTAPTTDKWLVPSTSISNGGMPTMLGTPKAYVSSTTSVSKFGSAVMNSLYRNGSYSDITSFEDDLHMEILSGSTSGGYWYSETSSGPFAVVNPIEYLSEFIIGKASYLPMPIFSSTVAKEAALLINKIGVMGETLGEFVNDGYASRTTTPYRLTTRMAYNQGQLSNMTSAYFNEKKGVFYNLSLVYDPQDSSFTSEKIATGSGHWTPVRCYFDSTHGSEAIVQGANLYLMVDKNDGSSPLKLASFVIGDSNGYSQTIIYVSYSDWPSGTYYLQSTVPYSEWTDIDDCYRIRIVFRDDYYNDSARLSTWTGSVSRSYIPPGDVGFEFHKQTTLPNSTFAFNGVCYIDVSIKGNSRTVTDGGTTHVEHTSASLTLTAKSGNTEIYIYYNIGYNMGSMSMSFAYGNGNVSSRHFIINAGDPVDDISVTATMDTAYNDLYPNCGFDITLGVYN